MVVKLDGCEAGGSGGAGVVVDGCGCLSAGSDDGSDGNGGGGAGGCCVAGCGVAGGMCGVGGGSAGVYGGADSRGGVLVLMLCG
ncbi:hypothetical protein ACROYT_G026862 [Oculina patagonica]